MILGCDFTFLVMKKERGYAFAYGINTGDPRPRVEGRKVSGIGIGRALSKERHFEVHLIENFV